MIHLATELHSPSTRDVTSLDVSVGTGGKSIISTCTGRLFPHVYFTAIFTK